MYNINFINKLLVRPHLVSRQQFKIETKDGTGSRCHRASVALFGLPVSVVVCYRNYLLIRQILNKIGYVSHMRAQQRQLARSGSSRHGRKQPDVGNVVSYIINQYLIYMYYSITYRQLFYDHGNVTIESLFPSAIRVVFYWFGNNARAQRCISPISRSPEQDNWKLKAFPRCTDMSEFLKSLLSIHSLVQPVA